MARQQVGNNTGGYPTMDSKKAERAKQDAFNRLMVEIEILIEYRVLRKRFLRKIIDYYKEILKNEEQEILFGVERKDRRCI